MKTNKHWPIMRRTRGVPPQSGDVFGGMPQSGDVLEEMKVTQNTFWRKMNIYCALRIPLIPSACEAFWRRTAADQAAEEYSAAFDSAAAFEVELVYRPIA